MSISDKLNKGLTEFSNAVKNVANNYSNNYTNNCCNSCSNLQIPLQTVTLLLIIIHQVRPTRSKLILLGKAVI